jgi:hypothetical protein
MLGSRGEDIIIGGSTDFDNVDHALCDILDEWTAGGDYDTRLTALRATLNSTTVTDDGMSDKLTGGADGLDWFLARTTPVADRISKFAAEVIDEI